MPVIVDIYCRVSTDDQEDNTSLDEQEACGHEYCRENGSYCRPCLEETHSGFYYRDEDLGEVRRRYQEGKIQGVVFRTLDRLSRKQEHVAISAPRNGILRCRNPFGVKRRLTIRQWVR